MILPIWTLKNNEKELIKPLKLSNFCIFVDKNKYFYSFENRKIEMK